MPMRLLKGSKRHVTVGDYYVNLCSRAIVEIMAVDPSGDVMVLDIRAALDAGWQRLTESEISSASWQRVGDRARAASAGGR